MPIIKIKGNAGSGWLTNLGSLTGSKKSVAQIVAKYIGPNCNVLDVGGTDRGFVTKAKYCTLPPGVSVTIVNTSNSVNHTPYFPSLTAAKKSGQTFDFAMVFSILTYMPHHVAQSELQNVYDLLNPGSKILITEPAYQFWGDAFLKSALWFLYELIKKVTGNKSDPLLKCFYSYRSRHIERMLGQAGFSNMCKIKQFAGQGCFYNIFEATKP